MEGAMRHSGHRPTTSRTRTRSGSEAIRQRVAHLMQTSLGSTTHGHTHDEVNPPRPPSPRSTSSREARQIRVSKDMPLPILPVPGQPRALKKKSFGSSARPENRYPSTSKPSTTSSSQAQHHSARVFDAMAHLPQLDHDLNIPASHRKGVIGASGSKHPSHNYPEILAANDIPIPLHEKSRVDVFRGPLAAAEYDRMKKEIESLKEALQDSKKASKRNLKKLEEAKLELNAAVLAAKDKESELVSVKNKHKKHEELLSTIESSIQCQICMDLPDKPFALSPCGHILCLTCLQEWFRKAPPTMDDMDIDPDELTDPHYILMRSKSCPTCRAVVKRRPVPVFMVKAIASALQKAKASTGPSSSFSCGDRNDAQMEPEDPWKGIFPSSEDDSEEPDSAEDYGFLSDFEDSEGPQVLLELFHQQQQHPTFRGSMFAGFDLSSDSDAQEESEEEEGVGDDSEEELDLNTFVIPSWAPPSVEIQPDDLRLIWRGDSQSLKLLRRGCNLGMIQNFDISYSHRSGIIVSLHSLDQLYGSDSDHDFDYDSSPDRYPNAMNRVYLGWNVSLQAHDIDGEIYLAAVLEDIQNNPSQWLVTPRPGVRGARDAKRLVRLDEVETYDTTDTEIWVDAENF